MNPKFAGSNFYSYQHWIYFGSLLFLQFEQGFCKFRCADKMHFSDKKKQRNGTIEYVSEAFGHTRHTLQVIMTLVHQGKLLWNMTPNLSENFGKLLDWLCKSAKKIMRSIFCIIFLLKPSNLQLPEPFRSQWIVLNEKTGLLLKYCWNICS